MYYLTLETDGRIGDAILSNEKEIIAQFENEEDALEALRLRFAILRRSSRLTFRVKLTWDDDSSFTAVTRHRVYNTVERYRVETTSSRI